MNKKNLLLIILFAITAVYYIPVINLPLAPYDEAVVLVGAERVLDGQVPHRDFSSEYPAGQLYTLAALFKVFGTSVFTERVYDLLIKSSLSICIFLIIRLLASNGTAFLGWLMSLVWLQHSSFPVYPVYPSLLFIYISAYLFLLHMKEQKKYYIVLSALAIVSAVMFRHDLGGYAAIVFFIILFIRSMTGVQSWAAFSLFISTGIIGGLSVIACFFVSSAAGFMFNDLVRIPLAFLGYQGLPYPSLSRYTLPFYVFPLVLVIAGVASVIRIKQDRDNNAAYGILLISCVGFLFFNQARVRSDVIHLLPVALTGILLAPVLLFNFSRGLSQGSLLYRAVFMLFIVFFGITLSKPAEVISRLLSITNGYSVENVNPDVERASHLKLNANLKDAVAYIKQNTSKNENIYVGVKNHDKFVFNDVVIYFLAERGPVTRYHTLNPGVHTTAKIQEELISELENYSSRLVVLVARSRAEPNLSSVDTQVNLLDNYISNNYELTKKFGMYEIWMKKL